MTKYVRLEAKDYHPTDEVKRHKIAMLSTSTLIIIMCIFSDSTINTFLILKLDSEKKAVFYLLPFISVVSLYNTFMYFYLLKSHVRHVKNKVFNEESFDYISVPELIKGFKTSVEFLGSDDSYEGMIYKSNDSLNSQIEKHILDYNSLEKIENHDLYAFKEILKKTRRRDFDFSDSELKAVEEAIKNYQSIKLIFNNISDLHYSFKNELKEYKSNIFNGRDNFKLWRQNLELIIEKICSKVNDSVLKLDNSFKAKSEGWISFFLAYTLVPLITFSLSFYMSVIVFIEEHDELSSFFQLLIKRFF
ncbi:hypothetical protein [Enterovibrio norvegicus]|uniref:hypothetical protein n=1 Tax=Enterovibrio norvegicus TaxID=188144 RepID=UPI00352C04DF